MSGHSKTGWLGDTTEISLTILNLVVFMIYYFGLVAFNSLLEWEMFHVYIICMNGPLATQGTIHKPNGHQ